MTISEFKYFTAENNCKIVAEERGLQDICLAMQSHDSSADLIESACSALWSLSMEGKVINTLKFNLVSLEYEL